MTDTEKLGAALLIALLILCTLAGGFRPTEAERYNGRGCNYPEAC